MKIPFAKKSHMCTSCALSFARLLNAGANKTFIGEVGGNKCLTIYRRANSINTCISGRCFFFIFLFRILVGCMCLWLEESLFFRFTENDKKGSYNKTIIFIRDFSGNRRKTRIKFQFPQLDYSTKRTKSKMTWRWRKMLVANTLFTSPNEMETLSSWE